MRLLAAVNCCLLVRCTISITYNTFNAFESWARQRHQIRVINVGCCRLLKSLQNYKAL
ncbi:CLUMA_CG020938, isoform A [Clunio marinus]|uniref:CLUMA_CG020938, isoform A n=1 Tax=Clunio marinus TaxID=568069 RepID=A0A1J1J693_9DIPT|nr:CLUMA_CG020938, isoform A [Clunio marinus]